MPAASESESPVPDVVSELRVPIQTGDVSSVPGEGSRVQHMDHDGSEKLLPPTSTILTVLLESHLSPISKLTRCESISTRYDIRDYYPGASLVKAYKSGVSCSWSSASSVTLVLTSPTVIGAISGTASAGSTRSISRIKSSSRHEVTIPNPVFRCSEIWGCDRLVSEPLGYRELGCIREMSQSLSSNVPDNSPEQEAATGHSIPRRLDSPTSQATQLPELELTLTPTTRRELSQEINNYSVPTLISQIPGPSRKRSRSPSLPFYPDATTFSDDTEDKELLISELQDSLATVENEIALLQIRVADAEDKRAEDHDQIQTILTHLGL
ncbi:hypothetical protein Tco_1491079 [Tanacetum coccineum]